MRVCWLGGQGAAAVLVQAEGDGNGFGLAAFLLTLLLTLLVAQAKDLAVGHAAGEVVDGGSHPWRRSRERCGR